MLLEFRRNIRGDEYVFINPDTAKPYTDVKKAFETACRLAGIHNLHWHDLRHTFGTRLAEAGVSDRRSVLPQSCHKTRTATFTDRRKCLI